MFCVLHLKPSTPALACVLRCSYVFTTNTFLPLSRAMSLIKELYVCTLVLTLIALAASEDTTSGTSRTWLVHGVPWFVSPRISQMLPQVSRPMVLTASFRCLERVGLCSYFTFDSIWFVQEEALGGKEKPNPNSVEASLLVGICIKNNTQLYKTLHS